MDDLVFSVGEFVGVFNQTLDAAYPKAVITGEVISANIWRNRLVFFDIKDDEASLSCMIPLSMLGTQLEEGMQVRIVGKPRLSQKGRLSISVHAVIPEGEGALQRAFVLLKQKLESQGLFDEERKRPLPEYPESIAVITAGQSAAWADFQKIIAERWPLCTLYLFDCQVQGDVASGQIVQSIESINQSSDKFDLLAIVRGGGSLEDLQSFRASTPTNAAQVAVPDWQQVVAEIGYVREQLAGTVQSSIDEKYRRAVNSLRVIERLGGTGQIKEQIQHMKMLITDREKHIISENRNKIKHYQSILQALDPRTVLKRGYAIARINNMTTNGVDVKVGDELTLEFENVNLKSEVKNVQDK